jgi:hypothetical protein
MTRIYITDLHKTSENMSRCLKYVRKKLLHLLLNKFLNLLGEDLNLLLHVARSTTDVLASLLNDDLDFLNIWNFKFVLDWKNVNSFFYLFNIVTTLVDDVAVVTRTTTVPSKILSITLERH